MIIGVLGRLTSTLCVTKKFDIIKDDYTCYNNFFNLKNLTNKKIIDTCLTAKKV